MISSNMV